MTRTLDPLPRAPEAIAAQKAEWDRKERRALTPENTARRARYDLVFPEKSFVYLCSWCGCYLGGHGETISHGVCGSYETETEPRLPTYGHIRVDGEPGVSLWTLMALAAIVWLVWRFA